MKLRPFLCTLVALWGATIPSVVSQSTNESKKPKDEKNDSTSVSLCVGCKPVKPPSANKKPKKPKNDSITLRLCEGCKPVKSPRANEKPNDSENAGIPSVVLKARGFLRLGSKPGNRSLAKSPNPSKKPKASKNEDSYDTGSPSAFPSLVPSESLSSLFGFLPSERPTATECLPDGTLCDCSNFPDWVIDFKDPATYMRIGYEQSCPAENVCSTCCTDPENPLEYEHPTFYGAAYYCGNKLPDGVVCKDSFGNTELSDMCDHCLNDELVLDRPTIGDSVCGCVNDGFIFEYGHQMVEEEGSKCCSGHFVQYAGAYGCPPL